MQYFIIGDADLVLAFSLVGVKGDVASNRDEALSAFKKITENANKNSTSDDDVPRVLILTENVTQMLNDEVTAWQKSGKYPLIVDIPGIAGHIAGRKSLSDIINESIGVSTK